MKTKYEMFWASYTLFVEMGWEMGCASEEAFKVIKACYEPTLPYIQEETKEASGRERASGDSEEKCQHKWVFSDGRYLSCEKCGGDYEE